MSEAVKVLYLMDQIQHLCKYLGLEQQLMPISGSNKWFLAYYTPTNTFKSINGVWDGEGDLKVLGQHQANFHTKEHLGALRRMYRQLHTTAKSRAYDFLVEQELLKYGIEPMP